MSKAFGFGFVEGVAIAAREAGYARPTGVDHVEYVEHVVRAMRGLATVLPGPRWLTYAYEKRAEDAEGGTPVRGILVPGLDEDLSVLAYAAPARWVGEVALLAERKRRTGRALRLIVAISRLQNDMIRHDETPVGRATPIRDDVRLRDVFLLVREKEIEKELSKSRFFFDSPEAVSRAQTRGAGAPERAPASEADGLDYGGWFD
jgi:hypothetical protein